jgi:hypothetical protein
MFQVSKLNLTDKIDRERKTEREGGERGGKRERERKKERKCLTLSTSE